MASTSACARRRDERPGGTEPPPALVAERDRRGGAAVPVPAGADRRAHVLLQRAIPGIPAAGAVAALVSGLLRQRSLGAGRPQLAPARRPVEHTGADPGHPRGLWAGARRLPVQASARGEF